MAWWLPRSSRLLFAALLLLSASVHQCFVKSSSICSHLYFPNVYKNKSVMSTSLNNFHIPFISKYRGRDLRVGFITLTWNVLRVLRSCVTFGGILLHHHDVWLLWFYMIACSLTEATELAVRYLLTANSVASSFFNSMDISFSVVCFSWDNIWIWGQY